MGLRDWGRFSDGPGRAEGDTRARRRREKKGHESSPGHWISVLRWSPLHPLGGRSVPRGTRPKRPIRRQLQGVVASDTSPNGDTSCLSFVISPFRWRDSTEQGNSAARVWFVEASDRASVCQEVATAVGIQTTTPERVSPIRRVLRARGRVDDKVHSSSIGPGCPRSGRVDELLRRGPRLRVRRQPGPIEDE